MERDISQLIIYFLIFLGHIYEHIISFLVKLNCNNFAGVSKNCCIWLKHFNIYTEDVIYNGVDTIYIALLKILIIN